MNALTMNCQVHGPSSATSIPRDNGKASLRCLRCQAEATKRYRKRHASHPDTPPGSYHRGLRTTQGIDTERKILPITTRAWDWIEQNHEKHGSAKSLLINQLLERAISLEDPKYNPAT